MISSKLSKLLLNTYFLGLKNEKTLSETQMAIKENQINELKQKENQFRGQTK